VSPLLLGRSTNTLVFVIGQRLERNGVFEGAILITVSATVMADFLQTLNLGQGSTISIFRDDGWLVARYPLPDGPMDLANYVLFTEHLPNSSTGTYDAISPADRVSRIVGYRKMENEPLVALASVATEPHFAAFWQQVKWMALS
jgi:hypothetical protein